MKFNGKILSVWALLVATSACYASEASSFIEQQITIKNETNEDIEGGIFLMSLRGKQLSTTSKSGWRPGDCKTIIIKKSVQKSKKITEYHKVITPSQSEGLDDQEQSLGLPIF